MTSPTSHQQTGPPCPTSEALTSTENSLPLLPICFGVGSIHEEPGRGGRGGRGGGASPVCFLWLSRLRLRPAVKRVEFHLKAHDSRPGQKRPKALAGPLLGFDTLPSAGIVKVQCKIYEVLMFGQILSQPHRPRGLRPHHDNLSLGSPFE